MIAGPQPSTELIKLIELLDAHFENNENPHVTIAKIWAALHVEWYATEGSAAAGPTGGDRISNKC